MACPLLITATLQVSVSAGVKLSDTRERVLRHMEGVVAWLRDARFGEIVFVKNCALEIRKGVLEKAAKAHGKRLEFLQVSASPRTPMQGKGYGEGDMLGKALEGSAVLAATESFCKVTGKLFYEPDPLFEMDGHRKTQPPENTPAHREPAHARLSNARGKPSSTHGRTAYKPNNQMPPRPATKAPSPAHAETAKPTPNAGSDKKSLTTAATRPTSPRDTPAPCETCPPGLRDSSECRFLMKSPIIYGCSGTLATVAAEFSEDICRDAHELAEAVLS